MKSRMISLLILSSLFIFIFNEDYKSYISKLNLDLEEVTIQTEDRYINTIWRLTSKDPNKRNGRSVIMQHGLYWWIYFLNSSRRFIA